MLEVGEKILRLGTLISLIVVVLMQCSVSNHNAEDNSKSMAVSDIQSMRQLSDGRFEVVCVNGDVSIVIKEVIEQNVNSLCESTQNSGLWTLLAYSNINFSGLPVIEKQVAQIPHIDTNANPSFLPSFMQDSFSLRLSRNLLLQQGNYKVRITYDDGIRVFFNGTLLINDWNVGNQRTSEASYVHHGGNIQITVEYFENFGKAVLKDFRIDSAAPPVILENPVNLGVGQQLSDKVLLRWDAVSQAQRYEVEARLGNQQGPLVLGAIQNAQNNDIWIEYSWMLGHAVVHYRVRAVAGDRYSEWSQFAVFQRHSDPPPPPQNVLCQNHPLYTPPPQTCAPGCIWSCYQRFNTYQPPICLVVNTPTPCQPQ